MLCTTVHQKPTGLGSSSRHMPQMILELTIYFTGNVNMLKPANIPL
jgi:hypothetical protein